MFVGSYNGFFSAETGSQSIFQIFPIDLKHLDSTKTERLSVEMIFAGANNSPSGIQLLVLSVHNLHL